MSDTPTPQPVDPHAEPDQIFPSATGLVVPSDAEGSGRAGTEQPTGEQQAAENEDNELPA